MPESQLAILFVFSGLLGLVVGSFLNVCIFRLPRNCMSIAKPARSRCPKCLNWIAWYDNVPVLSWVALGGKCRRCRNPISVRYTLVELLTGLLFLYAGWRAIYGMSATGLEKAERFAVDAWFVSAIVICTFVDLEFRIIPDEVSKSGIVIGLLAAVAFPYLLGRDVPIPQPGGAPKLLYRLDPNYALPGMPAQPHVAALLAAAAGAGLGAGAIYSAGVMGKIIFRRKIEAAGEVDAMGFGDVKLMAMVGAVLGWRGVLLTFLIGCLCGAIFGIGKFIVKRSMGYVPFGPFLAVGALAVLFVPDQIDAGLSAYLSFNAQVIDWILTLLGLRRPA
jgi:leader peptidase (prepilin peptidase)/N-methyltransferase